MCLVLCIECRTSQLGPRSHRSTVHPAVTPMLRALSTTDLWSTSSLSPEEISHTPSSRCCPLFSSQSLMVTLACCSSRRGCARTVRYGAGRGSWGVSQLGLSLVDRQRSCYSPSDHSNMQRRCCGLLVGTAINHTLLRGPRVVRHLFLLSFPRLPPVLLRDVLWCSRVRSALLVTAGDLRGGHDSPSTFLTVCLNSDLALCCFAWSVRAQRCRVLLRRSGFWFVDFGSLVDVKRLCLWSRLHYRWRRAWFLWPSRSV